MEKRILRSKGASTEVCWVTQAAKVQFLKFVASEVEHKLQQHSAEFFIPTHLFLTNSSLNL